MVKNGLLNRLQEQLWRRARSQPVVRTRQLAAIVAQAVGARTRGDWSQDPATRTFQALRIFVNRELSELALALPRIVPMLRARRPACRDQLPFARGPHRQALLRRARRSRSAAIPRAARLPIRTDALPGAPLALVGRAIKPGARARSTRNPRARSAIAARRRAHRASAARRTGRAATSSDVGSERMTRVNLAAARRARRCARCRSSRRGTRRAGCSSSSSASRREARGYETEYGQLQLEQSTWAMPARVEKIAREQLRMQLPDRRAHRGRRVPARGGAR